MIVVRVHRYRFARKVNKSFPGKALKPSDVGLFNFWLLLLLTQ
jgi:hypothetical protein